MPITQGQGNPDWTRDEVILVLDFYFDQNGYIPSSDAPIIITLSNLLRSLPIHNTAARKETFRNPNGVVLKLRKLKKIATGKGFGNISKLDSDVMQELGDNPRKTKKLANLIRSRIPLAKRVDNEIDRNEGFREGKLVIARHERRERNPKLRHQLLNSRSKLGAIKCDMCGCKSSSPVASISEAMFEAHHIEPHAQAPERITKLEDMALLCSNCHRMIHRAISLEKRLFTLDEENGLIWGRRKSLYCV
jgi:5-methylcytosine-specific restriction protein A